jgi:hypothetical protein
VCAIVALATGAVLAAGQWVAQLRLTDLLTTQLDAAGTVPEKSTGEYVTSAYGFWLIIAGLVVVAAADLYLMWRDESRSVSRDAGDARSEVSRHLSESTR